MRISEILIESYNDSMLTVYLNGEIKKWEKKLQNFNYIANAQGIDAAKEFEWYFNMFTSNCQKVIQKREKVEKLKRQILSKIEHGI